MMLNKWLFLFTIWCFGHTLPAQTLPLDSLKAAQLLDEAITLTEQKAFDTSNAKALEAADLFRTHQLWLGYQDAYYQVFDNAYYADEYEATIDLLETGLNQISSSEFFVKAKLYSWLAYCYDAVGQSMNALDANEKSAVIFNTIKDTQLVNISYCNIGITYTKLGDNVRAINILENAVATGRYLSDTTTLYNNLFNLGTAYSFNGNYNEALASFEEAQKLSGASPEDDYYLAQAYLGLKDYDNALKLTKNALQFSEKENGKTSIETAAIEKQLGEIYLAKRNYSKAKKRFKNVFPIFENATDKREFAKLHILIANTELALGNIDTALMQQQRALSILLPEFQSTNTSDNPSLEQLFPEPWFMEIFRGKGNAFYQKHQQTGLESDLQKAQANFKLAIDFIQNIKLAYSEEESKYLLGNNAYPFFEDAIKTNLELHQITQNKVYKEAAFQAAQLSKAFVLKEIIQEKKALELANIPSDTVALYTALHNKISTLTILLKDGRGGRDSLLQERLLARQQQQQLKKTLLQKHPKFANYREDLSPVTSDDIQTELDNKTLFVKYFEGADSLYTFAISQSKFQVFTTAFPSNYSALIRAYERGISDFEYIQDSATVAEINFLQAAHQLYQITLKDALDFHNSAQPIERLLLVADGQLTRLPFAPMQFQQGTSWRKVDDFLIAKYAIGYAYYCKSFVDNSSADIDSGSFIGFGLEYDDYTLQHLQKLSQDSIQNKAIHDNLRAGNLSKLPFADDEAQALSELMGGQVWANQKATKSNFLAQAPLANILHLSAHSIVDLTTPENSSLIFSKTPSEADCMLRFSEIFGIDLQANMLTLSACNTGIGKQQKSEGLLSLARAFRLAGVPAVIASYWSVADQASMNVMELFYQFLKASYPKDIALQKAKIEYLQNDAISSPHYRKPIYWAAWVSYGNQQAIVTKNKGPWWAWLLFVAAFLWIMLRGAPKGE